jgi:UDP-N-acetyl-D-galactosamine dehydrogenase
MLWRYALSVIKELKDTKICIIGLGYVGLPLAVEFVKHYEVTGFDISSSRIKSLREGVDRTREVSAEALKGAEILYTDDIEKIRDANVYIVTVPTPIDSYKNPDLTPLLKASETVGRVISEGDVVIYESTVYPGCTEEDCVPIIEKFSGLKLNDGFYCGYSPERINPGDKTRTVADILKITSGSTAEAADFIDSLYSSIITAGTHRASSIKVAEAAKVIENTQRDINIALMNELALVFDKMNIDTKSVLEAAGTKWNFMKFEPGLVGGHCIGVDPYYLTFKAQAIGFSPDMILSGRRVNDGMGKFIAEKTIKFLIRESRKIRNSNVLIAGFTFKENCPDVRNTKVTDIYHELQEYGIEPDIFDPVADIEEAEHEYGIKLMPELSSDKKYDAIIVAVKHKAFEVMLSPEMLKTHLDKGGILIDVKGMFGYSSFSGGTVYWRL